MDRARTGLGGNSFYEFRTVTIPPGVARATARQLLTAEAEYGRWELARTVLYEGGMRKIVLRRRAMKVQSTLATY